jgi:hypothetical protein
MTDPDPILSDWWALELAFGHVTPGHRAYLDRETGRVVPIQDENPADLDVHQRLLAAGDRFLLLDPVPSREQHRWMARFIATVADPPLQARLHAAILGPGAFRVFKDILQEFPDERLRWFGFRKQQLRAHITGWFADRRLAPAAVAPADVQAAAALRRRGHDLLELLPARDLPAVIAYLLHAGTRRRDDPDPDPA